MNKTRIFSKTLFATALLTSSSGAFSAAFQLAEVSTEGLGRAYAGEAAIAESASVVATNPALMTKFKQNAFSVGGVYIDSSIHLDGQINAQANLAGNSITLANANASQKNVVPGAFVPNLYFVTPINDRFSVGGGMNVNFGLKSEYADDYDAGIFGGTTDLTAINLNLSGAYKISQGWSAGLGLNVIYAKAKIERNAGIIDTALNNAMGIAAQNPTLVQNISRERLAILNSLNSQVTPESSLVSLQGDAWGASWNAGLLYEFNENNRIGFAYHSAYDLNFKDNSAQSVQLTSTGIDINYTGIGRLKLKLPAYWEISGYHKLTDKFAVHYSWKYTEWSRFNQLRGVYNDGKQAFQKTENYQDNTRIALGASYDINEKLTVRAGIAYDEAAAPRSHASASIPDTDRTWYSAGFTYRFTPTLSIDFGYAHLRGKKVQFIEQTTIADTLTVQANYTSKASANLYGLNLNYLF
ncbi:long-chain fatty acid transport protein [Volucribacter psittacicida]|uniref:Long-chain fatty acid transport protein n=1 Tax=Volucribacter psittacicida TaxID=203482 RepID=A0A4R1FMI2_9PAST|nr:outer membrane protein transport protein [Volucribacter psittacicida]TCJ94682.1 long-chain fatty acid transport protein [Volucribacter psittacicida]